MKNFFLLCCLAIGLSAIAGLSSFNRTPYDSMPKGSIIAWGLRSAIPRDWVMCNGANGTPNLINRFPYGTANSAEIGETLGKAEHSHTVSGKTSIPNDLTIYNGDNHALQKDGSSRVYHDHNFTATTSTEPLIPPATKVIFIMKIR